MKPIMDCAVAACPVSHRDANSSLSKFLYELVKSAKPSASQVMPLTVYWNYNIVVYHHTEMEYSFNY